MGSSASIQIVMVGLDTTGKTTILYRLKFGQYMNAIPTVGFNCEKIEGKVGKVKGVSFTIWDIGGKDNMRPLWKSYLRSADGIIFVIDSSDKERMEEAKIELNKFVKSHNTSKLPTLVIANKQDLQEALDPEEIEKMLSIQEISMSHPLHFLPACAVTGEGLSEAMDIMYEMIKKWKKSKHAKISR
ncbi:ADP-ribosylation factor-like protein 4C [Patella vulgata]|uniref:ADP-ribosylation factor-like protein 11 n=1 Tax=Patella caerulea TaxID=87958 RepID=A0AAN8J7H7_PATCE|nr:ADP-ribosylation factor-like protein 4C [Patella vulgata]